MGLVSNGNATTREIVGVYIGDRNESAARSGTHCLLSIASVQSLTQISGMPMEQYCRSIGIGQWEKGASHFCSK